MNNVFGNVVVVAYFKVNLVAEHLPESTCLPLETKYDFSRTERSSVNHMADV